MDRLQDQKGPSTYCSSSMMAAAWMMSEGTVLLKNGNLSTFPKSELVDK